MCAGADNGGSAALADVDCVKVSCGCDDVEGDGADVLASCVLAGCNVAEAVVCLVVVYP